MNKKRKKDEKVLQAIQSASNITNVNQLVSPSNTNSKPNLIEIADDKSVEFDN